MILLAYEPVPDHLERLQAAAPGREIKWASSEAEAIGLAPKAEIFLGNRYFLQSLPYAGKLRWMQSNSVGVDIILKEKQTLLQKNITITSARGVYDTELAEHTLALLFGLHRQIHLLRDEQRAGSWKRHRLTTVQDSRCLIVGWGSLGRKIGTMLRQLGANVSGVRNLDENSEEDGFQIFAKNDWHNALPHTDTLIICLPKTPDTFHFVGKKELQMLPANALVVNIGRGGTLDDDALLDQIQAGKLAGAGLDVFENEPLPSGSPVWSEPRILATPHVGRSLEGPVFQWQGLFEENLSRYCSGRPLLNVVDLNKGY